MSAAPRFEAAPILADLKRFQRDTVEYVHQRFWLDEQPAHRFLVADEVGLGKTLVARGVIAKSIEYLLARDVKRLDVVYICSNADIAQQNIARLNVSADQEFVHATRITLLPKLVRQIRDRRINFFAITPGTSFEVTSNQNGSAEERALIYRFLERPWDLKRKVGPLHAFRGAVRSTDAFEYHLARSVTETPDAMLDDSLRSAFVRAVEADRALQERFLRVVKAFPQRASRGTDEAITERGRLMQDLRRVLASVCIEALEPDLIILDEFQRFKHLLQPPEPDGSANDEPNAPLELARSLFEHHSPEFTGRARVLLLSATPYRMFSPTGDVAGENHYEDFIATYRFLAEDASVVEPTPAGSIGAAVSPRQVTAADALRSALQEYRTALLSIGSADERDWRPARDRIEALLRRFMARTERLGASTDRSGMLVEIPCVDLDVRADDIIAHREVHRLAKATDHPDTTDYWKSAPYIGAFGRGYKLLGGKSGKQSLEAIEVLESARHLHVPPAFPRGREALDPPHPRLRWLHRHLEQAGLYDMLWLPPSMPYYELGGVFEGREGSGTKRLIFSAWQMVPRAIASLLSTEAERRHFGQRVGRDLARANSSSSEPLVFAMTRRQPDRMSLLALLYPSAVLAELGDPLKCVPIDGVSPSTIAARTHVARLIQSEIDRLDVRGRRRGAADQRWYWAAPLLLDAQRDPDSARAWLERSDETAPWKLFGKESEKVQKAEAESGASVHFAEFARMLEGSADPLGPQPDDLVDVLTDLALGSPAICALRALGRGMRSTARTSLAVRDAAAMVAQGFRSFFNTPAIVASLRSGDDDTAYWRTVTAYGRDGCLQAVLDEWFHVLPGELGVGGRRHTNEGLATIAAAAQESLSLRAAAVEANQQPTNGGGSSDAVRFRTRFAVRLADHKAKDDGDQMRSKHVRAAFNAPFWPFVLVSTSVGQEGLDFHTYCHAVVHWNLPYNPVDLEQREGRVHRFKNHAVRRNAATLFGADVLARSPDDPWSALFEAAVEAVGDGNGVVPYWVLPCENGAQIERYVPSLPLSRDQANLARLRRDLTLYRMVFGQPRQDELLQVLAGRLAPEMLRQTVESLRINLAPGAWRPWSQPASRTAGHSKFEPS